MPKRKLLDEVRKVLPIKNYELLHGEIPHLLDTQVFSLPQQNDIRETWLSRK